MCKQVKRQGMVGAHVRSRWRVPFTALIAALVIVTGVCIFLYPSAASWFSQRSHAAALKNSAQLLVQPPLNNDDYRESELKKAEQYNAALSMGAITASSKPTPQAVLPEQGRGEYDYNNLLVGGERGIMGRIQYERLGIDLPVYHGTSDETLKIGVGHLEGTSLPVGGLGTRSVLTGHRGLATATMFNNLDKARVGDTIVVTVLGKSLEYRVVDSKVIDPEDTHEIYAEPTKDLISLITCTPLGINSQRILLTAERVTPTSQSAVDLGSNPPGSPAAPWWAVIIGAVIVVCAGYVWHSGKPLNSGGRKRFTKNPKM